MSTSPATTHPVVQRRRQKATLLADRSARLRALAVYLRSVGTPTAGAVADLADKQATDSALCASINNDRADYAATVLEGRVAS